MPVQVFLMQYRRFGVVPVPQQRQDKTAAQHMVPNLSSSAVQSNYWREELTGRHWLDKRQTLIGQKADIGIKHRTPKVASLKERASTLNPQLKHRIPTAWQWCHASFTSFSEVDTYDPGISWGSANQCILGDVYLTPNLSRKVVTKALVSSLKGRVRQRRAGHSREVQF